MSRQTCFIDMPFGNKVDPKTGVEIAFDQIYESAIFPAVEDAGLQCIRGDREETGGLIHTAMFARLLIAEFVVADMTTANPNVFYELGVRHAARPYTTIPIFATVGAPPFDVNGVRAIPYELTDGKLSPDATAALRAAILTRIQTGLRGPVSPDSPLFQLFDRYPGVVMSHEVTDVFRDRVEYSTQFRERLAAARSLKPKSEAIEALNSIQRELGNIAASERGVIVDLMLSYRSTEAYANVIDLYDHMSGDLRDSAIVLQQLAFALNRRNGPSDRSRAINVLENVRVKYGDSAETLGLLGRIYKDMWQRAKSNNDPTASGWLDRAIEAYRRGFETEPLDYFPGINALTLLLQKGDDEALSEHEHLVPLVTFAAMRKGGEKATDYWTLATMIELSCHSRNMAMAQRCFPRAVTLVQQASEPWMLKTTMNNLLLIASCFDQKDRAQVSALAGQFRSAIELLESTRQ